MNGEASTRNTFDRYTFWARFLPAAVMLLPAGLALAAWFPNGFDGWSLLVGLMASGAGAMLLMQIGRDAGKKKEPGLWALWGGQPAVAMLRHRDKRLDRLTRLRYHEKLAGLVPGCPAPTETTEQMDPAAADEVYTSWVRYLREATRNHSRFAVLFAENINYGFRRNLWGMKSAAVVIAVLGIAAALVRVLLAVRAGHDIPPMAAIVAGLDTALLVLWMLRFRPSWVLTAANAYAERLLAACEILQPADLQHEGRSA